MKKNTSGVRFASLPQELRQEAEIVLSQLLEKHSHHMTRIRYAQCFANAARMVKWKGRFRRYTNGIRQSRRYWLRKLREEETNADNLARAKAANPAAPRVSYKAID